MLAAVIAYFVITGRRNDRATDASSTPRGTPPPALETVSPEAMPTPPPPLPDAAESAPPTQIPRGATPPVSPHAASKVAPFTNSLGLEFVPVPGTAVLFARWETRVKDYRAFTEATQHEVEKPGFAQTDEHPAVNVSWQDANAFCAWLSKKEGRDYRLPRDAEWSAVVGLTGETGDMPKTKHGKIEGYLWGAEWLPPSGVGNFADASAQAANPDYGALDGYKDGFAFTAPVGSFPANAFGLYDLGGNAWEWCFDQYDTSEPRPDAFRVWRGASWRGGVAEALLASYRGYDRPDFRCDRGGFRVVLVLSGR